MMKLRFTLYASLALMFLVWLAPKDAYSNAVYDPDKCAKVGTLDCIQDVGINVACNGMTTIYWPTHFSFKYAITFSGGGALLTHTPDNGMVTFNNATNPVAPGPGEYFTITETCEDGSDFFKGILPDLDPGDYWYMSEVCDSASEFTSASPKNIPDLSTECGVTTDEGFVIRPSCTGDADGQWIFGLDFDGDCIDSISYLVAEGFTCTGSGTAFPPGGPFVGMGGKKIAPDDEDVQIIVNGLTAGDYKAKITLYSGSCTDVVYVCKVLHDGSDEPTVSCNDRVNVSVDGQCMVDIYPAMVMSGAADLCAMILMDSIVLKHVNGKELDPSEFIRIGDTLRLFDASHYIHGPSLIAEVHSTTATVSNYCWGYLVLEDKLPPILKCDVRDTVRCYHFDGTVTSNVKAIDCDPNPEINIINQQIITDCNEIGDPAILKRIIRTFNATDNWGNTSKTCTDTLDVRRLDAVVDNSGYLNIEGLVYPSDFLAYDSTAFVCDSRYPFADYDHDHIPDPVDFIVDEHGNILQGAGVPRIDTTIDGVSWNIELHPSNYIHMDESVAEMLEICKTVVTYEDLRLPRVACVEKVVRTWTIREFVCGHLTSREFIQNIEVVDSIGPSFEVPADMKVSTNQKTCERYMRIPPPTHIHDFCKKSEAGKIIVNVINDSTYVGTLSTDDGNFDLEEGGYLNIPLGENWIEYNVFDDCHNVTRDTITITVVDETPPVVICKEFLVVGIADDGEKGNGEVWIRSEAFDNGSYDDCGISEQCVVRMGDLNRFDTLVARGFGGTLTNGTPYVPVDSIGECDRVFEESGITEGGVKYIVKDDLCTPKMLVCCEDVGVPVMVVFRIYDKAGNKNECMVEVGAQDKRIPTVHCPPDLTIDCRFDFVLDDSLAIFGEVVAQGNQKVIGVPHNYILDSEEDKDLVDGVYFGNCSASVEVAVTSDINECRQGTITRVFTVTANNGNSVTCTQVIELSRENVLKTEDIEFPPDVEVSSCALPDDFPPDSTGFPTVKENDCTLIGWAFEDLTVRFNDDNGDACFKIIRQWTVIDWCKVPSFTIATGNQIIKINDSIDPVIAGAANGECMAKTADVIDNECKGGFIELSQIATDNCTEDANLIWNIAIDFDDDGKIDETIQRSGGTADISDDYPIGTHRIVWEVRDQCGNQDVCEQLFTIRNLKEPTPICITTITGSLMPVDDGSSQNGQPDDDQAGDGIADGGMLTVWASEYDIGSSSHPCDYKLVYSFQADSIVPSRDFTCFDLGVINLSVHVLALEEIDGEYVIVSSDFCSVVLNLDDNNNTCDTATFNPANVLITGNIHTEFDDNVPTVQVALEAANSGASTLDTKTDRGGMYAFADMPLGGSYKIVPELNKDLSNGVSTLDLVLIQKHILGLQPLASPYRIIAGDINKDGNISAIDLVELRKVILGISDEFTNNNSWRFIDEEYTFIDPLDPLSESFKENYNISELTRAMILNFVGVKIGDVNGNVNVTGLLTAPRSSASLVMENITFVSGQTVRVPVSFEGIEDLLGYQFTLEFDQNILAFEGFESGEVALSTENFGIQGMNEGFITSSWGTVDAINIAEGDAFILEFQALTSGNLSEVLSLTSNVTTSEAYSSDQDVLSLNLKFSGEADNILSGYELFQNRPNPFSLTTSIGFMLPQDTDATINIYDVTGKLVKAYSGSFAKGLNTISVEKSDLNTTGVLYYTLDTEEFISTRQMVLIK